MSDVPPSISPTGPAATPLRIYSLPLGVMFVVLGTENWWKLATLPEERGSFWAWFSAIGMAVGAALEFWQYWQSRIDARKQRLT